MRTGAPVARRHERILQFEERAIARTGGFEGDPQFVAADLDGLAPTGPRTSRWIASPQIRGGRAIAGQRRTIGFEGDLVAAFAAVVSARR